MFLKGALVVLLIVENSLFVSTVQNNAGILERVTGVSYTKCTERCDSRAACHHVDYTRKFRLCDLATTSNIHTVKAGQRRYQKAPETMSRQAIQCSDCADIKDCHKDTITQQIECQSSACSPPDDIVHAYSFGNMRTIGAKVKYVCQSNSRMETSKCQSDGKWSHTRLNSCLCSLPSDIQYSSHVHATEEQDGVYRAEYSCQNGYQLRLRSTPRCNVSLGLWSDSEYVCCDTVDTNWSKIYRYPSQQIFPIDIISSFTVGRGFDNGVMIRQQCFFRNSSVLDNWDNFNIHNVRLDIIKDEQVVAFMLFNGQNTDKKNWFTYDNLLNTSWHDLMAAPRTEVSYFSFGGIGRVTHNDVTYKYYARFLVSDHVDKTGSCEDDVGWFTITWDYYPCKYLTAERGPRILYAKNNQKSSFSAGEIEFADRMDIWIQTE